MEKFKRAYSHIWMIIIAVVVFDQVTKYFVRHFMDLGQTIKIAGNVIRFTYVENPGIAFGIHMSNRYIFTGLSLLASALLILYLYKSRKEPKFLTVSLAVILGGAFGNLVDRIVFGRVVDFLDIGIGALRWWIFNVADSAVVIGMIFLMIYLYRCDRCIRKE